MTVQTYAKLQEQIAGLEAQAAKLRSDETVGVVTRIKEAIRTYSLTEQDIFASKSGSATRKPNAKKALTVKYVDGNGGQWVGRGKRPKWLSEALEAGRKLEDFLADKLKSAVETFSSTPGVVASPVDKAAPKTRRRKSKPAAVARRAPVIAKYSDGAGNSWSGKGPAPKWLKEAIAGGKKRDDFLTKS